MPLPSPFYTDLPEASPVETAVGNAAKVHLRLSPVAAALGPPRASLP